MPAVAPGERPPEEDSGIGEGVRVGTAVEETGFGGPVRAGWVGAVELARILTWGEETCWPFVKRVSLAGRKRKLQSWVASSSESGRLTVHFVPSWFVRSM